MTVCCCSEDKDAQLLGVICCHRHYGCCPFICCKFDADLICWGFICLKVQCDPCWLPRMITHVLCIFACPSICPTKAKCFRMFCCNAKQVPDTGAPAQVSVSSRASMDSKV